VVEQGKEGEAFLFGTFKGIWEGLSMKDLTTYKVCDSLRVQHNKDGTTTKLTLGMVKALVPQADQEKMVEVRRNFFWCVPCCPGCSSRGFFHRGLIRLLITRALSKRFTFRG
jgi:hypothetical protein